jgi:outer membrane protein TolC
MRHAWLALALACGACAAGPGHAPTALHIAAPATPGTPWWGEDPLLTQLVERGLAQDAALLCRADALARRAEQAHDRRLKARLTRLIAPQDSAPTREADGYALAAARGHAAARITLAYVEARRWQARIALRAHALAPLADNGEIARFRREAGLVSALDGEMADLMTGLDNASLDKARAHLAEAIAALASLTGLQDEELRVLLGPDGAVPVFTLEAATWDLTHRADLMALRLRLTQDLARRKVSQATLDAALAAPEGETADDAAAAQWRKAQNNAQAQVRARDAARVAAAAALAPLAQKEAQARRAVSDARLAYRAGTESFATLYVAEGIALAAQESRIDANAALAAATVAFWDAQGLGWRDADRTPTASGTVCDQP